jgi:hypothetical protein
MAVGALKRGVGVASKIAAVPNGFGIRMALTAKGSGISHGDVNTG